MSICQDAALAAMNAHFTGSTLAENDEGPASIDPSFVVQAARSVRRRITLEMIQGYERWRDQSGVTVV